MIEYLLFVTLPVTYAIGQSVDEQVRVSSAKRSSTLELWGDQGNGNFINPVLPGDLSDLDAIRVGKNFYAISSTMQYSPGMVILHSRDLVNWEIVGHVISDLTALDPELGWQRMNRNGRGVWAGSIRYRAGLFWVYFGTPDGGIYVSTADRVDGTWSTPHLVLESAGWDDPCPLWDDDGRLYLVTTRFAADEAGQAYRIHLFSMTQDGMNVIAASDRIIHQSKGSEANKLYKIGGRYFHYFSEVRSEGRVAMMERATSLDGPWEVRQLNHVNPKVDKEPNQGGLIQLEDGRWWFLTHQGTGDWEGRAGVLLPVTWVDGWPIPGRLGPDKIGNMVWGAKKPLTTPSPSKLFANDELSGNTLNSVWEWRYQPRADMWSLTGSSLRLRAFPPLPDKGFSGVGNVLTQRAIRLSKAAVTVEMDVSGMTNTQEAGLAHFARTSCRLAVVQQGTERRVVRIDQDKQTPGPVLHGMTVWLQTKWDFNGRAEFSFSEDGAAFTSLGSDCRLSWGDYRGDRIGLYTFSDTGDSGSVEFHHFQYR